MAAISDQEQQKILEMFRRYDRDDSGQLSVEELAKVVYGLGWPEADATPEKVRVWLKDVDTNNDNVVSKEEFLQAYGKRNLEDRKAAQLRRVFKAVDKDGSGLLSAAELCTGLQECGFKATEDDVQSMFEALNKKGGFSIDGFVDWYRQSEEFDKYKGCPLK